MKKKTFLNIFHFMKPVLWIYVIGLIGTSLGMMFFQLQVAYMFRTLFDAIEFGYFSDAISEIVRYLIVIIIIIIATPLFIYMAAKASVYTTGAIRKKAFSKISRLPSMYFKTQHSAEITSRLTHDISTYEVAYQKHINQFVTYVVAGLGTTIAMFLLEWRMAFIALGSGLITLWINTCFAKKLRKSSSVVQDKLGKLNTKLSNIIAGVSVLRVFNLQYIIYDKFLSKNNEVYQASMKRVGQEAIVETLNALVGFISFVGIVTYGTYLIFQDMTSVGVIIAVVQLQNGVVMLIESIGSFITNLQSSLAGGDRVLEFLNEQEQEPNTNKIIFKSMEKNALSISNISFGYQEQKVIKGISLDLPKNKTIALVGSSGSGKTTLFKLILGLYPLEEGVISLNTEQEERSEIRLSDLISYVPQDAFLFHTTVFENIRYGKLDATEDEIIHAAKKANAHDFIMSLPLQYQTVIGEKGTNISGGQRQRIAIARAFLKDSPIILLDEATSALDYESEQVVYDAIKELMANRSVMVIAHRLETIVDADEILVMDHGKIIEKGTHEFLVKQNGMYTSLYTSQFKTT